jgi:hypothetical protein
VRANAATAAAPVNVRFMSCSFRSIVEFLDGYLPPKLTERKTAVPLDHRNVLTIHRAAPGDDEAGGAFAAPAAYAVMENETQKSERAMRHRLPLVGFETEGTCHSMSFGEHEHCVKAGSCFPEHSKSDHAWAINDCCLATAQPPPTEK